MKRRILFAVATFLILIGLFFLVRFVSNIVAPKGRGGLQITSNLKADVFLNNKSVGTAPFCLCDKDKTLSSGNYNLKIVPLDRSLPAYYAKITISPNVLTAVDRTFLPGARASSYILTLEKTNDSDAQLFVASIPDGALISIDEESEGTTPLNIKSLTASAHEVTVEKPGFSKKTVRVRAVAGFKLILNVILGTEGGEEDESQTASESAQVTQIPTLSPTPAGPQVVILSTPTGFLRVRATPSTSGEELAQVKPDETFTLVDENDSWFQIQLADGTKGWISRQYAKEQ
jgi:hypothetical protein